MDMETATRPDVVLSNDIMELLPNLPIIDAIRLAHGLLKRGYTQTPF